MRRRYCALLAPILVLALMLASGAAQAVSRFDPANFQNKIASPHFTTFYNTTGDQAVTDDQARMIASTMEEAYDRLVTGGHLHPLHELPEPVVAGVDDPDLGGTNAPEGLYYRQWIFINTRMGNWTTLRGTVSHELFHSIQTNYQVMKTDHSDDWVIEGTAPVASFLAYPDDAVTLQGLLTGHMNQYWSTHAVGFMKQKYAPSLFWYDLASRYGGLGFLDRFFQLGGQFGWERAIQYTVLEKGGPKETTFDTVYREFMMRMLSGAIALHYPDGYGVAALDDFLLFRGSPITHSTGWVTGGLTTRGTAFAFFPPLYLDPWSFHVIELVVAGRGAGVPVGVRLSGDPGLELYAMIQGADGTWRGLRAARAADGLVLPPLQSADKVTLAVARMGTVGSGRYAISVDNQQGDAPGTLQPLTALSYDPAGGPLDGTPAALTADQLAALRAGKLLPPVVTVTEPARAVTVSVGQTTYGTLTGVKTLPVAPVMQDRALMIPVDIAPDLGVTCTVKGNQAVLTYQGLSYTVTAGSTALPGSDGSQGWMAPAAQLQGGTLLVPDNFWFNFGFEVEAAHGQGGSDAEVIATPPSAQAPLAGEPPAIGTDVNR